MSTPARTPQALADLLARAERARVAPLTSSTSPYDYKTTLPHTPAPLPGIEGQVPTIFHSSSPLSFPFARAQDDHDLLAYADHDLASRYPFPLPLDSRHDSPFGHSLPIPPRANETPTPRLAIRKEDGLYNSAALMTPSLGRVLPDSFGIPTPPSDRLPATSLPIAESNEEPSYHDTSQAQHPIPHSSHRPPDDEYEAVDDSWLQQALAQTKKAEGTTA